MSDELEVKLAAAREEFEKLPEIARMVACKEIKWCDVYSWYRTDNTDANSIYHVAWLNGAWYAYQEQQKKSDEYNSKVRKFIKELERTWNDDKDSTHDFWRGFAECAGASKNFFLRDVGEIK